MILLVLGDVLGDVSVPYILQISGSTARLESETRLN